MGRCVVVVAGGACWMRHENSRGRGNERAGDRQVEGRKQGEVPECGIPEENDSLPFSLQPSILILSIPPSPHQDHLHEEFLFAVFGLFPFKRRRTSPAGTYKVPVLSAFCLFSHGSCMSFFKPWKMEESSPLLPSFLPLVFT